MSKEQGLLSELKTLQKFASERLAEKEAELRGLSQTDSQLAELQNEIDGLQPDPARWNTERQALVDHIEELGLTRAIAEARWRHSLEASGQNVRHLETALQQTRAELNRAQQNLAQRDAVAQAEEAERAERRKQLRAGLSQGRRQLAVLRDEQRQQQTQRTVLLARLTELAKEQQRIATVQAEPEPPRAPDPVQADHSRLDAQRLLLQQQADAARGQLGTLQAEQQRLSQERAALLHRVAQLEQAFREAPAAQPAEARTWDAERSELRRRVVQLEQALQTKEQRAGAERSQFAVDLNQMRQQLAEETTKREEWQLLQQDRAQLQARVQDVEQRWMAREAAIVQERALWQRYLESFTVVAPPAQPANIPQAAPAPSRPAARPVPKMAPEERWSSSRRMVVVLTMAMGLLPLAAIVRGIAALVTGGTASAGLSSVGLVFAFMALAMGTVFCAFLVQFSVGSGVRLLWV